MFSKPTNTKKMFFTSVGNKQREPIPVFQTNNNPTPVIRQDVEGAFTIGQSRKYLRSSGLEK
jgi:hypothetical protein